MGFISKKVQKGFGLPETSLKDAREAMKAAPDLMRQANELRANAAAMGAAQQAAGQGWQAPAMAAMGTPADTSGPDFQPVSGVSLEQYAAVAKEIGADQSRAATVAMSHGISPSDWEAAQAGWAARMQANRAVGQQFNHYYMGG
jgi:hypothetical protein